MDSWEIEIYHEQENEVYGVGNRALTRRRVNLVWENDRWTGSAQRMMEGVTLVQVQSVAVGACESLWKRACQLTNWARPEQTMAGMIATKVCSPVFLEEQVEPPGDTVDMNHVDRRAYVEDDEDTIIYDGMCCHCDEIVCICDPDEVARQAGKVRVEAPVWEDPGIHFDDTRRLYNKVQDCKNRPTKLRLIRQQVRKWVNRIRERKALEESRKALTVTLDEGGMRMKGFSVIQRWLYGDNRQAPPLTETSGWFWNRRDPVVIQRGLSLLERNSGLYAMLKIECYGMTAKNKMAASDKAALVYKVQVVVKKEITKGKLTYPQGLELMPVMIEALSADTRNQTMIPHMLGATN